MSTLQKQTRILTEHDSDGTHNSSASATLKSLFSLPLSIADTNWFKYYESSQQTITSAGSLTLAHSLGVEPKKFQLMLVCQTAEHGYSIGDKVCIAIDANYAGGSNARGVSLVPDSTNLNIRYGAEASVFQIVDKTSGVLQGITNGNWKTIFRAWA